LVRVTVFVLALCWWTASLRAGTLSPETVLARVEAFYREIRTLSGSFSQEVYWRKGYRVEVSGGKFWFKKTNLLRWEYRYPERILIVSDGRRVYYYSEEDRQVLILSPEKAFSRVMLAVISGKARLSQEFELVSGTPGENGFYFLELKPQNDSSVSRLKLKVRVSTGEIKELWFWDPLGNLTHMTLENLRINPKIDKTRFAFRIPKGVEVIDETRRGERDGKGAASGRNTETRPGP